jgi:mono/diheme cytochrome c family protein
MVKNQFVLGVIVVGLLSISPNVFAQNVEATQAAQATEAAVAGATNPFAGDQTAIMLGKVTFEAQCATQCHPKADAWKGGKYPDLFDCEWLHGGEEAAMFQTVTEGVAKTEMLGWKGKLSDDAIWKVITYLKSASQCQEGTLHSLLGSSRTLLAETAH